MRGSHLSPLLRSSRRVLWKDDKILCPPGSKTFHIRIYKGCVFIWNMWNWCGIWLQQLPISAAQNWKDAKALFSQSVFKNIWKIMIMANLAQSTLQKEDALKRFCEYLLSFLQSGRVDNTASAWKYLYTFNTFTLSIFMSFVHGLIGLFGYWLVHLCQPQDCPWPVHHPRAPLT